MIRQLTLELYTVEFVLLDLLLLPSLIVIVESGYYVFISSVGRD